MPKVAVLSYAHMHAGSYSSALKKIKNTELACIWDEDAKRGSTMAERFKAPYIPNLDDVLAKDIDAVIVCTSNIEHKDVVIKAAKAKKHVMCEKPLAVTVTDGKKMIEECRKNGVILMTAFPCRYSTPMMRLKQVVEDGLVGDILAMRGTNRGTMPGGWFVEKKLSGGGAMIDHTVHVADLMRWVTGKEVKKVYAECDKMFYPELTVDDTGLVSMEFEDNIFASLDTSWSRPKKSYPVWGDVNLKVVGTKGIAEFDLMDQKTMFYSEERGKGIYDFWGDGTDDGLVNDFIDCVEKGKPASITGEDGLAAVEIALGAYQAVKTGKVVKLPLE
ncbi:MAG: Gfo/Idh/MocA family oxidoreductase [Elusimicrobiota bacterium]